MSRATASWSTTSSAGVRHGPARGRCPISRPAIDTRGGDAPLSVRRAYSVAELTALLAAAGIRVERRFDGPFGHRVALAGRRNGHG